MSKFLFYFFLFCLTFSRSQNIFIKCDENYENNDFCKTDYIDSGNEYNLLDSIFFMSGIVPVLLTEFYNYIFEMISTFFL